MTFEPVNPTRMDLMALKERTALARMGYQIIRQKRDVLLIELKAILDSSMSIRDKLNAQMRRSYASLMGAQSHHGPLEMEGIAMSMKRAQATTVRIRNAMGVKLPQVSREKDDRTLLQRGYSIPYTSARVDEAAQRFEETLEIVMEAAQKELSMKRLLMEIEKTQRRVNALDYIVLPWLTDTQNDITIKLDEMERQDLLTLKEAKRKIEALQERTP
jgi:V/A-type H+/Na+-transporting ATPase subunit D